MQSSIRVVFLLLVAIVSLAGCDTPRNDSAAASSRVRLDSSNADSQFGEYVVRVSGLLTSDLTPEIAQSYGIVRSESRGFVNLVVLRKDAATGVEVPVKANVTLSASNLTGQLKNTAIKEIEVVDSIYYIVEVDVTDREIINFDFDVRPIDSNRLLQIRFTYEFYAR